MIPFEFEFVQPVTLSEATDAFAEATSAGKSARFLSGGTELVTMARAGKLSYDVLIDLKRIPETTIWDESGLIFGACTRLSKIADEAPVPLLASAARGVADRTVRNSISLGGNICGMLPYRETVLPLLICDAEVTIAGSGGVRTVAIAEIYDKRLKLANGEFLVSVRFPNGTPEHFTHRRRTRDSRVDYPLSSLCLVRIGREFRLAVSGAFSYPVRSKAAEDLITDRMTGKQAAPAVYDQIAAAAADAFEPTFRTDPRASGSYRRRLLELSIAEGLAELEATS